MTIHSIITTCLSKQPAAALVLPLLILLAGCDSVTDAGPAVGRLCPVGFAATETSCAPDQYEGEFTIVVASEVGNGLMFRASGAIEDIGHVEDAPKSVRSSRAETLPSNWSGRHVLRGAVGTIAVSFEGQLTDNAKPTWTGRFLTLDDEGTGAYTGLRGEGTFTRSLEADGHPTEVFVGRVYRLADAAE